MNLAARARAMTTTRRTRLPGAGCWGLPLVLAGLAVSSACSVEPGGAAPSDPATPVGSPTTVDPTTFGTPSPSPSAARSSTPSSRAPSQRTDSGTTPIRVVVGDRTFMGELYDNPTARDLASRLPLTITMDDLHGTEKTGPLPRALTTDGAPRGSDPDVGEIGYYAPGRDLVFYYGDMGYYAGIVRVGRFDGSIDRLADVEDGFSARVEVA